MDATQYRPDVLAGWMADAGESAYDVARATGLSHMTIYRLLSGATTELGTLARLAAHFRRPLAEIVSDESILASLVSHA